MTNVSDLVKLIDGMIEDVENDKRVMLPDATVLDMLWKVRAALAAQQDVEKCACCGKVKSESA